MSKNTFNSSTFAADPAEPTLTFADLENVACELSKAKPILKEVRVHPSAYRVLRDWLDEVRASQFVAVSALDPVQTFGVYGTSIRIDKNLKRGEWRAIGKRGEGFAEGSLELNGLFDARTEVRAGRRGVRIRSVRGLRAVTNRDFQ